MDKSRARSIAVDLCGLNLINQPLILDVSRLFANSVTFQHNSDNWIIFPKIWFAYNETLRGDVQGNSSTSGKTLNLIFLRMRGRGWLY